MLLRGELYRAIEIECQPSRRSGISCFVQGGTVGMLPEPKEITSSRLLVFMFLNKNGGKYPPMASVLIAQHHTTLFAFVTVVDYMFLVLYCDDCLLAVLGSTSLVSFI